MILPSFIEKKCKKVLMWNKKKSKEIQVKFSFAKEIKIKKNCVQ